MPEIVFCRSKQYSYRTYLSKKEKKKLKGITSLAVQNQTIFDDYTKYGTMYNINY